MTKEQVSSKHKVIMLVDDNNIDNFINEKVIKKSNFTENVFVHTNAKSALEFLKNLETLKNDVVPSVLPSVIFLDINMPGSDGFYFLEEFNKLPKKITSDMKIVMLTSSLDPKEEVRSISYDNVVKYLSKPLSVDDLINMN